MIEFEFSPPSAPFEGDIWKDETGTIWVMWRGRVRVLFG